MYWIFLILFIIAVLVPDVIRGDFYFLSQTRVEELMIFLMGATAFFVFIRNEQIILFHKKEKEKDEKKINQTVKDLVESYSYIGEVNRKMDILMHIALGLTERSFLDKHKEKEIYESIVSAANFLLKADCTILRFVNIISGNTEKEFRLEEQGKSGQIKNAELTNMEENVNVKKCQDSIVISSPQAVNNIKGFLIIKGYDDGEEKNPKNIEILKVFASQAIFLYSYVNKSNEDCACPE